MHPLGYVLLLGGCATALAVNGVARRSPVSADARAGKQMVVTSAHPLSAHTHITRALANVPQTPTWVQIFPPRGTPPAMTQYHIQVIQPPPGWQGHIPCVRPPASFRSDMPVLKPEGVLGTNRAAFPPLRIIPRQDRR